MTKRRDSRWLADRMPAPDVLEEVLSGDPVSRLLGVAREREIVRPHYDVVADPDADEAPAAAALEKAAAAAKLLATNPDAQLTPDQQEALKLFILLVSRPALFVQGGRVKERPQNWPEIKRDELIIPDKIAGVGRFDSAGGTKIGTGFVVGDRRVMTNNHVVCALLGLDLSRWRSDWRGYVTRCDEASARWAEGNGSPTFEVVGELLSSESHRTTVTRVLGHHAEVDMAVLELATMPSGARQLTLASSKPDHVEERRVYAVGYPIQKGQAPHAVFQRIFGAEEKSLGTKRFSPGTVIGSAGAHEYHHDASTLAGSSGSCIVDFDEDRVVGLHYAGSYESQNYFVPLWKFRRDPVLASAGVVFGN